MSEDASPSAGSLPLSRLRRVEAACDRFESAWNAGPAPRIEDFLTDVPESDRAALFRELLELEIELRRGAGERPTAEEYHGRFAEYIEQIDVAFVQSPRNANNGPPGSSKRKTSPHAAPTESSTADPDPPRASGSPPLPGQIGRYRVIGRLGGGTYGDVYLAHDPVMDRQVAIKVPTAKLLATERAKEEFLREARNVARLKHEGIVEVHDFPSEANGECYLVYELVDGESLDKRIQRMAADPMPPDEAARIVAAVASALHYAHLQEIFHRDIKPANILLDRQGRPKVTDFGLAVREADLAEQRGVKAGTLPYMSPEQVRRESHHIDGRTDIYSLGVVLYELLCGRRPFEGKTSDELEDQILHREAKPPRQLKDAIPQALERVCLKSLSKRVQDRYATAKDMATEVSASIGSKNRKRDQDTPMSLQEVERRMASADEDELRRLLRCLQKTGDLACVRLVFSYLSHSSEPVRQQARKVVHSLGWDKVSASAEAMARQDDAPGIASVLTGLAAFEAHPQIVALLDKLVVLLKGDLRNRTILLLERKRLGLELVAVAVLFCKIHSPYRIEKALGQGLFAAAYLAHVEGADLAVVVRVLRPEFVGQPHVRARFLDLGKQALKLVHENLVLTREARAFPGRNMYFTVRDYVNGVTLQKVLEGGKRFEPAQIVRILRQLLAALGAVHRQGMCHGGVKPSNVFVCGDDRVVLGDVALPVHGIGVALDRLSYDYRYAAPETLRGDQIAAQSDFYSLGCLAYELACAEPPFVADNYLELAALHMHGAVVPPSRRSSRLGPAWDEVLLKLLARPQADRFASAHDILGVLDRLEDSLIGLPQILGSTEESILEAAERLRKPPLLREASLAGLRGTESVLGFDDTGASMMAELANARTLGPVLPAQAPEQPATIGDFEILESLGTGGMGIVYKARDRRLDRVVALKMLRTIVLTEAERRFGAVGSERLTRFLTEARAVGRLQHPHIVQIHEIGEHDGQPYIALEYVGGGSLSGMLRTQTLAPRAAAEMVAKLARAVQHAHEHGVLHRDLKPSNVLLTIDGEPKIGDFGLAKIQELSKEDAALTHSGMIIGTPSYMAPEQAAGEVNMIGPATDIYGLGAILYVSLIGRPPFQGENVMRLLSQLATAPVIPPNTLNPDVGVDLSAICLKCLEKDPAKRYSSAKELAEDLERWCTGQPIQARPTSSINRFLRWCRRSLVGLFVFRKRS